LLFNSLSFAAFIPVVYVIYLRLPLRWQNVFLLAASYVFYASWDWRFLSLILFSTAVDYWVGLRLPQTADGPRRTRLLLLSLSTNLGLLGVFKYFGFFAQSLGDLLTAIGFAVEPVTLRIVLPVGISFYTFQTLSYTVDVYRRRLEPEPDPVNFALFVAFFPQLVAGPIERAARMLPQIRAPRLIMRRDITAGLWYVLAGYYLKVFVADNLAPVADAGFSTSGPADGWGTLLGVYAFAFQIFGDFAGYSSIAIGIARLMGFHLTTNFLHPYIVSNPRDFWRSWHISLSTWLRDYLYIPLGGNSGGRRRLYRNLFLTMLLGGLWHGAAWTFVVWGVFHGSLLIAHRVSEARLRVSWLQGADLASKAWWGVKVVLMFQLTCVGWLIFRAPSFTALEQIVGNLARTTGLPTATHIVSALHILFYSWLAFLLQLMVFRRNGRTDLEGISPWIQAVLVAVMFYSILVWGSFGESPFIYFQF
jgi:D-alanyl-lipoteichoic acid acyltransferase DltB (MBOAT superfamily)